MGRVRSSDKADDLSQLKIATALSKTRVARLAVEYDIRGPYSCLTPLPQERVSSSPSTNTLAFYEDQLKAGLRFPLHQVFCDILRIYRLVPSRLSPNSIRLIHAFIVLCRGHGIMPRASLFTNFFVLRKDFHGDWWWMFVHRPGLKLLTGAPSAIHGWKPRFFFVYSAKGWDFDTKPRGPHVVPNDEGKYVLEGDKVDFDKLVKSGVGERASEIPELLDKDCLHLAGIGRSVGQAEEEMVKPAAAKIRELARKKRLSTREAEGEARKKRREGETSSTFVPPVGKPVVSLPRGEPPSEVPQDAPCPVPTIQEVGEPAERVVADPDSASGELPAPGEVPTRVVGSPEDSAGAPGVVPDGPPIVIEPEGEQGVGPEARESDRAPEIRVGGLTEQSERKLLKRVGLTLEEFDRLFVPDEPRAVDLGPYQGKKALEDVGLAEAVLKATLLPKDWEETQGRPLEELAKTVFSDLLKVVHSASALSEGVESALDINRRALKEMARLDKDLITGRKAFKAWKEIAVGREVEIKSLCSKQVASEGEIEEMKKLVARLTAEAARRDQYVKGLADEKARMLADFNARLSGRDHEIGTLMLSVQEAHSATDSVKVALDDTRKELQRVSGEHKSQLRERDGEIASLKLSVERAVADYKSSEAFGEEVAEAGASSYDVGFRDGLKQVKKLYPELDLSSVEPPEDDEDEDVADAPAVDPSEGPSG